MSLITDAKPWMIYGANGYTGRLCAMDAVRRGLRPIVAGRGAGQVQALAGELALESRVFDLSAPDSAARALEGVAVVLNCAGPFSTTARSMLDACVRAGCHYLDITGEIPVFEYVRRNDGRWTEAGIVALPGVGFDVVPTDCMAAMLKEAMPGATRLVLAFKSKRGRVSPGTAKTMLEGLAVGSAVRRGGSIITTPLGALSREIPYADGSVLSVSIPWGDVSTAHFSTGIPDIEVYTATSAAQLSKLRRLNQYTWLARQSWMQGLLKRLVGWKVVGPDERQRVADEVQLYGEVSDGSGHSMIMTMQTPNGYSLTHDAAITAVTKVLAGLVTPGAQTPSRAFGSNFLNELVGVNFTDPSPAPGDGPDTAGQTTS